MTQPVKTPHFRIINKSLIARMTGYSITYVHQLLKGQRKNTEAMNKVASAIKQIYK